jgi:hypothetical protein
MNGKNKPGAKIKLKIFTRILVFAIVLGIIEDVIAILLTTKETITPKIILIIIPISIVFAIIGEIVINKTHLICSQIATK